MAFNLLSILRRLPLGRPISPVEHDRNIMDNIAKNFELLKQEIEIRMPSKTTNGGFSVMQFTGPITDIGWVGGTYTAVTDIPMRGWALVDGSSFSVPGIGSVVLPDWRDRFIVGAGSTFSVGDTGGSNSANIGAHDHGGSTGGHSLTVAELAPHTHTYSKVQVGGSTLDGLDVSSLNHEIVSDTTGSTGSGDAHSHSISSYAGHDNKPLYYASAWIAFVGYLHS